jgi:hypothetical protein
VGATPQNVFEIGVSLTWRECVTFGKELGIMVRLANYLFSGKKDQS